MVNGICMSLINRWPTFHDTLDTGMVLSSKFCLLIPPGVGGLVVNVLGIQSTLSW